MNIATLPPTAHIGIIQQVLQKERTARAVNIRGAGRADKIKEIDMALESLEVINRHLRKPDNA
jgi:hypothetical protein